MKGPKRSNLVWWLCGVCLTLFFSAGLTWPQDLSSALASTNDVEASLRRAIDGIRSVPSSATEYDYIMTARVRLLLFWAGKDDVGGGYIRRGVSNHNPDVEFFQILMGSDPVKAPRAINRWGAAAERVQRAGLGGTPESSTFFGFMKTYKGNSPTEMRRELDGEKQGTEFLFSAIVNQANSKGSVAKTVPFASHVDFNIHQLDQTEPVVFDRLEDTQGKIRAVDPNQFRTCGRPEGFLSTVAELVDAALDGRKDPESLCYIYNGQFFRLTLTNVAPVERESVHLSLVGSSQPYVRDYRNLLLARFDNFNETTRQGSTFDLLLGTEGDLRGVPVRISYQPNWWFQVVLNLKTPDELKSAAIH